MTRKHVCQDVCWLIPSPSLPVQWLLETCCKRPARKKCQRLLCQAVGWHRVSHTYTTSARLTWTVSLEALLASALLRAGRQAGRVWARERQKAAPISVHPSPHFSSEGPTAHRTRSSHSLAAGFGAGRVAVPALAAGPVMDHTGTSSSASHILARAPWTMSCQPEEARRLQDLPPAEVRMRT